ncbi:MAG: C-type lectin domain-containing protein, partial [Bacteroidetes bacterium]
MKKTGIFLGVFFFFAGNFLRAQCNVPVNSVYGFTTNGISYELIKMNMTWTAAAACAVQRGGKLAEIMSKQQNDSVFHYVKNKSGINLSSTQAPDGGGASYVWIGGNDKQQEGVWIWDGDGNLTGPQFWQGTFQNGYAVGGYYVNWGSVNGGEPDDFSNQDALGLSLTPWPFGNAGEWNDISENNTLYFVIQYPSNPTGIHRLTNSNGYEAIFIPMENQLILKNAQNIIHVTLFTP